MEMAYLASKPPMLCAITETRLRTRPGMGGCQNGGELRWGWGRGVRLKLGVVGCGWVRVGLWVSAGGDGGARVLKVGGWGKRLVWGERASWREARLWVGGSVGWWEDGGKGGGGGRRGEGRKGRGRGKRWRGRWERR